MLDDNKKKEVRELESIDELDVDVSDGPDHTKDEKKTEKEESYFETKKKITDEIKAKSHRV